MRNRLITGFLLVAVICLGICLLYMRKDPSSVSSGEVVFMDSFRVFEEFAMKKEYDKMLEKEIVADRSQLDSMGASLQRMIAAGKGSEAEINARKTAYFRYKESYDVAFNELSGKYTGQVYERLNGYIKEFGKQQHYRVMLGSNGQGNVMYVDKKADITDELIRYINKKYLDN